MQPLALRAAEGRPRRQRVTPKSTFRELTAKIQAAGLLRRRYGFYWSMMGAAVIALAGIGVGMVLLGDSWLQLLLAGALGVVMSQLGFLGHEAAHRQMFRSPHWNEWVARVLSTLLVGLSYGWWMNKHNRHHANPNKQGNDPDVNNKCRGLHARSGRGADEAPGDWRRVQGFFFLPLLLLEGMSLHVASIRYLIRQPDRQAEAGRHRLPGRPHRRLSGPPLLASSRSAWPQPSSACSWPCSGSCSARPSPPTTSRCRSCPRTASSTSSADRW